MPAIPLHRIKLPDDPYRLDLHIDDFETTEFSRKQDEVRIRGLTRVMRKYPKLYPVGFARLKKVLAYTGRRVQSSLASSRCMRLLRVRVLGQLFRTWHTSGYDRVSTVHIIPRGWDLTRAELIATDPNLLMDTLRTDLNKAGAGAEDGYLAAFIHGEFDAASRRYQLHVHALVAGGILDAVERLRKEPKYASGGDPDRLSVYRRIVVITLSSMPAPLTYILKAYWNWAFELEKDGEKQRRKARSRMPEPYHSIYLLWLNKWGLGDISLLMKLRVGKDGLILVSTRNESTNKTEVTLLFA